MRISDWSSDVCSSDLPPHQAPQENRTAASQNAQANDLPSTSRIVAMAVRRLDLADRTRPGWIVRRLLRCPGGRRSRQRHEKPREAAGLRVSCACWLWVESNHPPQDYTSLHITV